MKQKMFSAALAPVGFEFDSAVTLCKDEALGSCETM